MGHAFLATLLIAALTGVAVHLRARRYGADQRSDPETAVNLERLRRMELTADANADPGALADALASLARRGYLRVGSGGRTRWLAVHPPLPERVRRLRSGEPAERLAR